MYKVPDFVGICNLLSLMLPAPGAAFGEQPLQRGAASGGIYAEAAGAACDVEPHHGDAPLPVNPRLSHSSRCRPQSLGWCHSVVLDRSGMRVCH